MCVDCALNWSGYLVCAHCWRRRFREWRKTTKLSKLHIKGSLYRFRDNNLSSPSSPSSLYLPRAGELLFMFYTYTKFDIILFFFFVVSTTNGANRVDHIEKQWSFVLVCCESPGAVWRLAVIHCAPNDTYISMETIYRLRQIIFLRARLNLKIRNKWTQNCIVKSIFFLSFSAPGFNFP